MESEPSNNFNERLSQWVSNQGFLFQIRYSMTGSGTTGTAMFHLLRMALRLSIFLLVVAVGGWIYLVKYSESGKFSEKLERSINKGLSAEETEMTGFSKTQGQLQIPRVAAKGGVDTFFNTMEARNLRCRMGLLAGIAGKWETGTLAISSLKMDLRAGADDGDSAAKIAHALFDRSSKVELDVIEVSDASLTWGYSSHTRGSIYHSALRVQRMADGMRLQFKGGTFSQNWLRQLEIVELTIACDREGMKFEKAEFRRGEGTVQFANMQVTGGERPQVSGTVKIRKLALPDALPAAFTNFVEGTLSGNFTVTGSTNSAEGVKFAGQVRLDGQDTIALRDSIYLLKTLSMVDYVRSYRRVEFREGSFRIQTGSGGIEVSDIDLKAEDQLTLTGNLSAKLPTEAELREEAAKPKLRKDNDSDIGLPIYRGEDAEPDATQNNLDVSDFTLRRAVLEAKRGKDGVGGGQTLTDRVMSSLEERQKEVQASERAARNLRYDGKLRITIAADAFERAPRLQARYPVDAATGRIGLDVPLKGTLYDMTFDLGEELLEGRR